MGTELGAVFIGGLDRSGKTPLRRILEASTDIAFSRRTYLWTHFDGRFGDLRRDRNLRRCLDALGRYGPIRTLGVSLAEIEAEMRRGPRTYPRLFGLVGSAAARQAGTRRWGDQEGGVEDRIGSLLDAFPEARVIHMLRDPRDRHVVREGRRRMPGALGVSTARWRANARRAMANLHRHPEGYLVVRYEDLVHQPGETAERVARFLGGVSPAPVAEAARAWSGGLAPKRGCDVDEGWRSTLTAGERRFVARYLRAELEQFGYPAGGREMSVRDWVRYTMMELPMNGVGIVVARAATAARWLRRRGPKTGQVRLDEAPA